MLGLFKKHLPLPVKQALRPIKQKTVDSWQKKWLFQHMRKKHQEILKGLKGKEQIRVVFLAIHKSVWKVDPVFKKMLADPYFEPLILVCPYTSFSDERMREEMEDAYNYFFEKGYPVQKSLKSDGSWVKLEEVNPDIVFFTNPHNLTLPEYYDKAYKNYLSCYVPYHHEIGSYGDNIAQYDQVFHNAMWLIFSSNESSYDMFKKKSTNKAKNVILTGYPAMESILEKLDTQEYLDKWKSNDNRVRIIWAPHHTIDSPELPYSNFIKYAMNFKEMAVLYQNQVTWSFKPHPILKTKLYNHPEWGKEKTDEYYLFWKNKSYTQLDEGEYSDLFCSSTAMIHDSGSFLAEYLYLKKPVLYMLTQENNDQYFSPFGIKALKSCRHAREFNQIVDFIDDLVNKSAEINSYHGKFLENETLPYFINSKPSDRIINCIFTSLT
ncbi:CDP-glycerol glycerophosphotransferase family protein [Thiothrix lacustris]|uniref:CDP-glycerol glycerophosphotransferase family protein n=1 Tax=Thiothrix lacustris TaxID=525917 RepID=A0ABY9MRE9_9GAMM|nr:CDP-glycerol glycerophosphotransferase family protein [Thiothrix lacustris]WML90406.1 CDP-glycerol glycerophosphotransferase family protein [Thiothrix lacustris]